MGSALRLRGKGVPRIAGTLRALALNATRMRFESRQRINGSAAEVEQAMLDDRYLDFLLKHHGVLLEVQLLEKKDDGSRVTRKVRYRPKPVISSIGPKTVP